MSLCQHTHTPLCRYPLPFTIPCLHSSSALLVQVRPCKHILLHAATLRATHTTRDCTQTPTSDPLGITSDHVSLALILIYVVTPRSCSSISVHTSRTVRSQRGRHKLGSWKIWSTTPLTNGSRRCTTITSRARWFGWSISQDTLTHQVSAALCSCVLLELELELYSHTHMT